MEAPILIREQTVAEILRRHGIPPAPKRQSSLSWSEFIRRHQDVIAAADFFTVEVMSSVGLVTYYVLFFMHLDTRRVQLAGITTSPDERWMKQVARNLTMADCGFLAGRKHLILDRDTKYTTSFRALLEASGIDVIRLPPRSPNLNAYCERWILSVKSEVLSRMVFFGVGSLREALQEYLEHFHSERNYQGKDNVLLFPRRQHAESNGDVKCRERLGGMLKFYYQEAA